MNIQSMVHEICGLGTLAGEGAGLVGMPGCLKDVGLARPCGKII